MSKKRFYPQWKGFERSPEGCLLDQIIDLSPEMGFAYERSCDFYKDFHSHDRLMLVFPRGASKMLVRTKGHRETYELDSSSVLLLPKGIEHDDEGKSNIYDTMALFPSEKMISEIVKKLEINDLYLNTIFKSCIKINRSKKLEHYLQEFFFEKVIMNTINTDKVFEYLSEKILLEVLFTLLPKTKKREANSQIFIRENSITIKALQFIESNLFLPINLEQVAFYSGASISTLLRNFKKDVKQTPYSYLKNRRLEEAHSLLQKGSHSIGEVALLIGYENFGSFTNAFKDKYGKIPSFFMVKK